MFYCFLSKTEKTVKKISIIKTLVINLYHTQKYTQMKKQLLTAIAVCLSLCGYAQTKGTNALGFGIVSTTEKTSGYSNDNKNTLNSFTLSYGHFIKDNTKIGVEVNYGENKQETINLSNYESKVYGGNINYQRYFPIVKTLYAYAGGKAGYSYSKGTYSGQNNGQGNKNEQYGVGAYGGVTWFVSKRFAFETSLLSANVSYSKTEQSDNNYGTYHKNTRTSFDMSTQGFINNLGFKIYLLF